MRRCVAQVYLRCVAARGPPSVGSMLTGKRAAVSHDCTAVKQSRPRSEASVHSADDDWTLRLTPFLDATHRLLLLCADPTTKTNDDVTASTDPPAALCKHVLSVFVALTEETCRSELLTAAQDTPLPGAAVSASSLRLLVFVQCVASLLEERTFCSLPDAVPYLPTLRACAISVLEHYGPAMIAGRTARGIRGITQTELAHVPTNDGDEDGCGNAAGADTTVSLELATLLLDATSAVLRLSPALDHNRVTILRSLLKPALWHVGRLTKGELCELTQALAKTSRIDDATRTTGDALASTGTLSYEEHADFVVLCGEVVRRAEAQVAPHSRSRKEFSKSSAFTFSLKQQKERARQAEREPPTQMLSSHFTIGDLSEIATALAVVRFHDGTFVDTTPSSANCGVRLHRTTHHVWHAIAATAVHLIEAEMDAVSPMQHASDTALSLSFTRKDLQSICFACDHCCQHAAYDTVMHCLVRVGIVGQYIPAPSAANLDAMHTRGTTVD